MSNIDFIRKISNINSNLQLETRIKQNESNVNFKDLLNEKIENGVTFSKHANERITERNIDVNQDVAEKLKEATEQAKDKGLKNILVMIDNQAFIVSTMQNKVITALNSEDLKENIFTNIDGAVIK